MGFRFRKSIKIAPGVRVNLSKSGVSLSLGGKGATLNVGSRGTRATLGLPGTGLYYTTGRSHKKGAGLALEFLQNMLADGDEKAFIDACATLAAGDAAKAYSLLEDSQDLADGAFLAGVLALTQQELDAAASHFERAKSKAGELGKIFAKYELVPEIGINITEEIAAQITPSETGIALAEAEIWQAKGMGTEALARLDWLAAREPDNLLGKLSTVELLLDLYPHDTPTMQRIISLTEGLSNESPIHTALMYHRAQALQTLGLLDAAKGLLSEALKRKKDRPIELLLAITYQRGLVYEALGQAVRARQDFESVYAQQASFEDVAARLKI